jgi:mycofactocin precursor
MRTDELTTAPPPSPQAGTGTIAVADVEEHGELLIEEISIDGMCGVY